MKVKIDIRDCLADRFGGEIEVPATIDLEELFESTGIRDELDLDIHELLEQNRVIAHLWGIEDVQVVRPDLGDDQAWEVLKTANRRLDSEHGICWDTLETIANELFGPEPQSWAGRIDVSVQGYDHDQAIEHFTELAAHIAKEAVNSTTRASFDPASLRTGETSETKSKKD